MNDTAPAAARPFRILGLQQIAIGGPDKAPLRALWVDLFGLQPAEHFRSERENVDEDIVLLGRGAAQVEVDLMQPVDPARSPRVDQPALNHIGLWVDDLAQACAWLRAQGVRFAPGGSRRGAAGYEVAFVHPRPDEAFPLSGAGVLIELVQAPPDVIAALAG